MAADVGSPVSPLRGRECRPGAVGTHLEPGEFDLEAPPPEVEFVWAVVVVEPDDGVVRAGGSVVKRVRHALLEPVRPGNAQEAHPDDGSVVVGGPLVPKDDHVVCHPCP